MTALAVSIVTLQTAAVQLAWDTSGITLPGGHRVQEVPA